MMLSYPVLVFLGFAFTFGGCLSSVGATTNSQKDAAGDTLLFGLLMLLGALALWIFGIVNAYRSAERASQNFERRI